MNMNVLLPRVEYYQRATISHRKCNSSGETVVRINANSFLDNRVYESDFPDGEGVEILDNTVATNLFDDFLYDGHNSMLFRSLLYHKSDMTVVQRDGAFVKRNGSNSGRENTTRGWKIIFEWFDGTMTWEKLSDLKEFYPVQVAEYASGNGIIDEPSFAWWARYILKKRRDILSKVKTKYWSHTAEARNLYKYNWNTLCQYAIDKDMKNNVISFDIKHHQASVKPAAPPVGYKKSGVNMIFDVKLDAGFTRKARLVSDGHKQDAPYSITYLSVVSRDIVRTMLALAALNSLDLQTADVQNVSTSMPELILVRMKGNLSY